MSNIKLACLCSEKGGNYRYEESASISVKYHKQLNLLPIQPITKFDCYCSIMFFLFFYVLLTVHSCKIFCKQKQLGAHIFLICLLLFSTCFRQLCAHHQENTVPMLHPVFVTLYRWLSSMQGLCPAYQTVIYIEWQIPGVAYVRFLLMIGTQLPETCREKQ